MPLLTQGKTNWKFLLIVIVLAIIVGVGIFWYSREQTRPPTDLTQDTCSIDNDCQFYCGCGCVLRDTPGCPNPNFACEYDSCNSCRCLNGQCVSWSEVFIEAQRKIDISLCQEIENEDCKQQCLEVLTNLLEDETADWQTYKDENVTFKLPSGWIEEPVLIRGSGYTKEFKDLENKFSFTFLSNGNYNQVTGKPYENIDEYINMPYQVKTVIIDEQEGRQPLPRAGSENINSAVFFSKDLKFIYTLTLKTGNTPLDTLINDINEGQELFNQVLSTFRFIEVSSFNLKVVGTDDETGWNIGRSDNYRFEIKYPSFISPSTTAQSAYLVGDGWTCWQKPNSTGEVIASFVTCQFSDVSPATELYYSFTSELRIGASSDSNDVKNCFNFWDIVPVKKEINGVEFRRFKTGDAAVGNRASVDVYRTIHDNTCFSIEKLEYGWVYDALEYLDSPHYNYEHTQKFNSCREPINQMLSTFKFLD